MSMAQRQVAIILAGMMVAVRCDGGRGPCNGNVVVVAVVNAAMICFSLGSGHAGSVPSTLLRSESWRRLRLRGGAGNASGVGGGVNCEGNRAGARTVAQDIPLPVPGLGEGPRPFRDFAKPEDAATRSDFINAAEARDEDMGHPEFMRFAEQIREAGTGPEALHLEEMLRKLEDDEKTRRDRAPQPVRYS